MKAHYSLFTLTALLFNFVSPALAHAAEPAKRVPVAQGADDPTTEVSDTSLIDAKKSADPKMAGHDHEGKECKDCKTCKDKKTCAKCKAKEKKECKMCKEKKKCKHCEMHDKKGEKGEHHDHDAGAGEDKNNPDLKEE